MENLTLEIYLDDGCFACEQAEALAASIDGSFARVEVIIHRLREGARLPAGIVAVPAFVLAGRLIQYGTPEPEEIKAAVQRALGSGGEGTSA